MIIGNKNRKLNLECDLLLAEFRLKKEDLDPLDKSNYCIYL